MDERNRQKESCSHNNPKKIIKHGTQNGAQRYKCKVCDKIFYARKARFNYTRREKRFLSMLLNFLNEKGSTKINLKEALANIDIDNPEISKFQIIQREPSAPSAVFCFNPRLLICVEGEDIVMYRFEERNFEETLSRSIKIVDENKNRYKNSNRANY